MALPPGGSDGVDRRRGTSDVDVADDDASAFVGKTIRGACADASRTAGDD
jgi:hypothetical protein